MSALRFLQTPFWANFKGAHGWKPYFFTLNNDLSVTEKKDGDSEDQTLSVLVRSFSVKIKKFSIAYIPMAPEKKAEETVEQYAKKIQEICTQIKSFLPSNTICIRLDPPVDFKEFEDRDNFTKEFLSQSKSKKLLLKKSKVAVQPPDTTVLNILPSEEELLANMKSKWRYNIRLAAKKGVEVLKVNASTPDFELYFDRFYELFETTSQRDKVAFHAKDYYLDLLHRSELAKKESDKNPEINLYLAKHEDDYLAGIITLFCEREAVYLYGASGNVKRNFMPAYLLQWTAIQDAKKSGCPSYDFYGMPPTDDENHPMHGLYLFKTGFGGDIIHRPGSFDLILKKSDYRLYTTAEKIRAFYFKVLRKKI